MCLERRMPEQCLSATVRPLRIEARRKRERIACVYAVNRNHIKWFGRDSRDDRAQ